MQKITVICAMILLLCATSSFAKREKPSNAPFPKQQIQVDPDVLKDHQKRFGNSVAGTLPKRALPPAKPTAVETSVGGPSTVEQVLELPVVPKMIGDMPYTPRYKWGKQPTLKELLQPAQRGPRKEVYEESKTQLQMNPR